jgi:hypothetical protein
MALSTHSKFYYGLKITTSNQNIDFQEGVNVKVAKLSVGTYTGASLLLEIKKQMDNVGDNVYTVAYSRSDRKFTISSTVNFSLLVGTGNNIGLSAFPLLGYTGGVDLTGASSYVATSSSGSEYKTQMYIQSYKPTSNNRKAIDGVINRSSSGIIEVVKFGNESYMSGELNFITNVIQETGSVIRSNPTGVEDYIAFISWCTEKGLLEFMVDENKVDNYEVFILESTEADSKGLDFDLVELYDRGLPEFFRSGLLKFKLIGA